MEKRKLERKPPLSFVNRGGKRASGVAVGDEDPHHSPMDDQRKNLPGGHRAKPATEEIPTRSSRV